MSEGRKNNDPTVIYNFFPLSNSHAAGRSDMNQTPQMFSVEAT